MIFISVISAALNIGDWRFQVALVIGGIIIGRRDLKKKLFRILRKGLGRVMIGIGGVGLATHYCTWAHDLVEKKFQA
jgi:hypothetical protein